MRVSLGAKIILSFILMVITPLAVMAMLVDGRVHRYAREQIEGNFFTLLEEVGSEVERTLFTAQVTIQSLAESALMRSDKFSLEEKQKTLENISQLHLTFNDIALINRDGIVLASSSYSYRGEWKYKEWFTRALNGETIVSPPHILLLPTRAVATVVAPVRDANGSVQAVLGGEVSMGRIWEIIDEVKIGETGFLFIIDQYGNIIGHPDKTLILSKMKPSKLNDMLLESKKDSFVFPHHDYGKHRKVVTHRVLTGYKGYQGQGWHIGIIQDLYESHQLMSSIRRYILIAGSFVILFMFIIVIFFTHFVTRPVAVLSNAADAIAAGNLQTTVDVRSNDEFEKLASAFNNMADNLQKTTVSRDALVKEINERRKAESVAREQEEQVNAIIQSSGDAIRVIDTNFTITHANNEMAQLVNMPVSDIVGKKCYEIFPSDYCHTPDCILTTTLKLDQKYISEVSKKLSNGEEIQVEIISSPFKLKGKSVGIIESYRDISERKKAEEVIRVANEELAANEKALKNMLYDLQATHTSLKNAQLQLLQSEKMAAVGQLSAGVAHEVKNPLAIILLSIESLESKITALDKETGEYVRMIKDAANRANNVVVDLLSFSRQSKISLEKVDMRDIIDNTVSLIATSAKIKSIAVTTDHATDEHLIVNADKMSLGQVFLNLLGNAIDATDDNGAIVIKAYGKRASAGSSSVVCVDVSDTGKGMSAEVASRVFEPFFTTKEQGKGTGLGLSVAYKIIENHKGDITVKSTEGHGTTFTVCLPMVADSV